MYDYYPKINLYIKIKYLFLFIELSCHSYALCLFRTEHKVSIIMEKRERGKQEGEKKEILYRHLKHFSQFFFMSSQYSQHILLFYVVFFPISFLTQANVPFDPVNCTTPPLQGSLIFEPKHPVQSLSPHLTQSEMDPHLFGTSIHNFFHCYDLFYRQGKPCGPSLLFGLPSDLCLTISLALLFLCRKYI